jgi:hypothetical protein
MYLGKRRACLRGAVAQKTKGKSIYQQFSTPRRIVLPADAGGSRARCLERELNAPETSMSIEEMIEFMIKAGHKVKKKSGVGG